MSSDDRRALPARKVYYDWDDVTTKPDQLSVAFEATNPGSFDEETTTAEWIFPALALLVGGFFLGRWWAGRSKEPKTVVAGEDFCGFDMLGVV
jgi:hypothetical protein